MDSFELNKLLAAILGTLFVVMSVGIVADSIFAAPVPERSGFVIEAAEAEAPAVVDPSTGQPVESDAPVETETPEGSQPTEPVPPTE